MGIRDYFFKPKERENREGTEENTYREISFEKRQKIKLIPRIFGTIGKFFGKFIHYASVATVIPAAIAFYRAGPERDSWQFRENNKNAYVIKEYFDGTRSGVIGPNQTGYFNKLIERDAKHPRNSSLSNIVDGTKQEGSCEFKFRTVDEYEGKMKVQYLYHVENEDGAKKWFWEYATDKSTLDEIVRGAFTDVLGRVKGTDIAKGVIKVSETDEKGDTIEKERSYAKIAEDKAKKVLEREGFGIRISNFARESVNFDPSSQAILVTQERARMEKEAERERAQQRIIKAESESLEAEILKEATLRDMQGYLVAGRNVANSSGQPQKTGDYAMALHERDNTQQIANSGGRIIYVPSGISGGNPPVVMPVNYGPINPKEE